MLSNFVILTLLNYDLWCDMALYKNTRKIGNGDFITLNSHNCFSLPLFIVGQPHFQEFKEISKKLGLFFTETITKTEYLLSTTGTILYIYFRANNNKYKTDFYHFTFRLNKKTITDIYNCYDFEINDFKPEGKAELAAIMADFYI